MEMMGAGGTTTLTVVGRTFLDTYDVCEIQAVYMREWEFEGWETAM